MYSRTRHTLTPTASQRFPRCCPSQSLATLERAYNEKSRGLRDDREGRGDRRGERSDGYRERRDERRGERRDDRDYRDDRRGDRDRASRCVASRARLFMFVCCPSFAVMVVAESGRAALR